jgi:hypothetical protein
MPASRSAKPSIRSRRNSGTGKTHLLIALGTAAAEAGQRVKYTLASRLVNELAGAADERQLSRLVARYGRVDLGAVADPAVLVLVVSGLKELVELGDRVHDRHRDRVGAAEPATLTLHAALLVGAVDAGLAVERVETTGGAERDQAVGLKPVPAEQDPRHRRLRLS